MQSPLPPQVTTPTIYQGIRVESIQQTVFVNVFDNSLDGNRTALATAGYTRNEGLGVTNSSATSPNILFRGNNVTDFVRGVFHETGAVPTFTCNNFAGNTTGVLLDAAATNGLIANNNNITGNGFGMQNNGPATVNAQGNWWGAANGPGPVGPGSGDNVSTNVDFSGWLTATSNCPPPCATNVAAAANGATAVASSTVNASYPAAGAIDGEHDGNNWGASGGWNDGTATVFPDNIQVNLNVIQLIDTIDVYTLKEDFNSGSTVGDFTTFTTTGITNFDVQTWNGAAWVTVPGGSVTGNNRVKRRFSFATSISTDQIRVVVNSSADNYYSRVVEIEAFSCAPVPVPTPTPNLLARFQGNNVALPANGGSATASSQINASYPASGVIDGEHNGNNWGSGGGWNDGTATVFPDTVQVNFTSAQTISEIDVYTLKDDFNNGSTVTDTTTFTGGGITNFNVQYWTGAVWTDVPGGSVAGNNLVKRKFIFPPLTTNMIRVVVNASADSYYSRVVEIEAFACAPVLVSCVNPGGTGGCYASIQAAINAATPGATILVAPGTYTENLTLNKSLTLRGNQAGVSACGRSASESIVTAASGTLLTLVSGSAGSVIDGFTFSGGARGIESGSGPLNNIQILNNRVVGFTGNGIFLNDPGTDITVNQNSIDGSSKTGGGGLFHLDTDGFDGFQLTNNCISNGVTGTGFFVDGNHNVGESATRDPLIDGNLINNNGTGMNLGSRAFGENGIPATGTYGGTISNNTFRSNNFDGLQGGIQHVLVAGNVFSFNGRSGLALTSFGSLAVDRGAQNSTITCNTFTGNGFVPGPAEGLFFSSGQVAGSISTNVANNNNIQGNNRGVTYNGTEAINATSNWWGSPTGPTIASNPTGTGDSIVNPSGTLVYAPFLASVAPCAPAVPPPPPNPCAIPANNVARASQGSTATASSTVNASYPAGGVIDSEHDGNNWGSGGGWNDGTAGVFPDNVQVNFLAAQTISQIDVYTLKDDFNNGSTVTDTTTFIGGGITSFDVQYWTGSVWANVPGGSVTGNNLVKRKFQFPPITTDRIRVVVNASADNYYSRVVEIEAFACSPVPVTCVNPGGTGGCYATIQGGIDNTAPGGTVIVSPGTYDEDVNVNKANLTLRSSGGPGSTNVRGPIGGAGSTTVLITASNVTVAGFAVTRLGNNTTDWNNAGLNSAGFAIQGQAISNALIRDNIITGMRSGIDINNSNGHTIRNNVIDFNHTGMILRNQTDFMTIVENFITNNRTVGVLFLEASGGTNVPVQTAAHSAFSNNDMSGNWYGQIVDRQSGGSVPTPGTTNLKNFRGNWLGTTSPVITTANSAEPGYAVHIPVAYGGTATPPGGQPDVAGPASDNFRIQPILQSGTDTNVESTPGWGTGGFQGDPISLINAANANTRGWFFFDDNGVGVGSTGFEVGEGTPPLGNGSAFFQVDATAGHAFEVFGTYHGTRMDDITSLLYSSYQNGNANPASAVALDFDIDYDLTDGNNAFQGRLVFEPYQTPSNTVQQLVWQNWDALAGRWWASGAPGNGICPQATPCTWAQVLTAFPNAGVRNTTSSGILFKAGSGGGVFDGNVDALQVGIRAFRTTYNFQP